MARTGSKWDEELCAVHDGTIGSFDTLKIRLKSIDEWRNITKREAINIARVAKIGGGTVAVALAATGAGAFAAPAIGGAVGSLAGLSGAAATSHGLAVLGGGALAAGGFGMAGGTAVIAVGAGLLGGIGGGVLTNKYVGEIDGFDIFKRNDGSGTQVIFVNGFLSQGESLVQDWKPTLRKQFPNNKWYEVAWESKNLQDLGNIALQGPKGSTFRKAVEQAAKTATKEAPKKLAPLAWLSTILDIGGNPWFVALSKAQKTGQLLADLILRADGRARYVLFGHSLGARVLYYTLQALAEADVKRPRIREAHLLGGAVGRDKYDWIGVDSAVEKSIYNYYSKNDDVLRILYQVGTLFMYEPIGLGPIETRSKKIRNIDVTNLVGGHSQFKPLLPKYICS